MLKQEVKLKKNIVLFIVFRVKNTKRQQKFVNLFEILFILGVAVSSSNENLT